MARRGIARGLATLLLALSMAQADGADAGIAVEETATCPIGGAEFTLGM